MSYINELFNSTTTENGAGAKKTTGNPLQDLLALGGASDGLSEDEVVSLIYRAIVHNGVEDTYKVILYLADIREGQGRRLFFERALEVLHNQGCSQLIIDNIQKIPELTRWDYVIWLVDFPYTREKAMVFIKKQLLDDLKSESPSLLCKWMPSINTSNAKQRKRGLFMATQLGLSKKEYRTMLSAIRGKLNVIEKKMSAKEDLAKVDFKTVPKKALMKYKEAFSKVDSYNKFIEEVNSGKINLKTMAYPHEVVRMGADCSWQGNIVHHKNEVLAHWKMLPDHLDGNQLIVVADTSGSMSGEPMLISKSLAVYCAERLGGSFKGKYITFSDMPILQELIGTNVVEKYNSMESIIANTNIEAVFDILLKIAVATKEHIPNVLIISDMQFDEANNKRIDELQLFDTIERKYQEAEVEMPKCIFWNVNARRVGFQVKPYITHVSGYSPQVLKMCLNGKDPLEEILKNPRYNLM